MRSDWVWMPHPGHFVLSNNCKFVLNTYVNGYIVSTIGELVIDGGYKDIALGRKYETMVFTAKKSKEKCCPFEAKDCCEIDFEEYNNAGDAYIGHLDMCVKYDNFKENKL